MDAMPDTIALRPAGAVIHPTAVVARGAELGTGVRIGPFCTVGANVAIDDRVELVSHVVVDGHTRIGADVVLYPFCTVGLAPQDLKYAGQPTRCEIGARTQVREHCTIHRGTVTGKGITRVGADCLLMAVAHVAHDCTLGDHVIIANNVGDGRPCLDRRPCGDRRSGGDPSVCPDRPRGDDRWRIRCRGGRDPVRQRDRQPRPAGRAQCHRPEAARLRQGADPVAAQCVPRPVPP